MRTPVLLVSGQTDTDAVVDVLARDPGTVIVTHRFDGHIVKRTVAGIRGTAESVLELAHGCVSCTVRDDLLVLLRKLHRRDGQGIFSKIDGYLPLSAANGWGGQPQGHAQAQPVAPAGPQLVEGGPPAGQLINGANRNAPF